MLKLMTTNRHSRKSWLLPMAFLGVWGLAMYALSAQPTLTSSQAWMLLTPIRKGAHIIEFAVLTGIVWVVLTQLHRLDLNIFKSNQPKYWLAFLFSLSFAILDETHQYFVPNRQGQVQDVVIDAVGIILALGLIWLGQNGYLQPKRWAWAHATSRLDFNQPGPQPH
ncbi:MAG: VanZ family protein [Anaerolineae bacterium]|nr:VanZ family protein [Anaerolineae bacterium]